MRRATLALLLSRELDVKAWRAQVKGLGPLFQRYELDDVVWYCGRTKERLHVRFVW